MLCSTPAERVAAYPTTVLISGESGTGKEVVAQFVHAHSERSDRPFVPVNCAAIPETLIESELFGHAKGAFTGAGTAKAGLFEEADGGTLFLDEIGDLPRSAQASLLRVLQEGEVRRVGEAKARPVDVRVIAATACDLGEAVASGDFRDDLYYRLNVVPIHVPALRDRPEDIAALARHFARTFAVGMDIEARSLSTSALHALASYPWPGNVRELRNTIERACVLGSGPEIRPTDLPFGVQEALGGEDSDLSVKRAAERLERDLIARALARTDGNRTRAAKLLDLSYRALLYKIDQYGLAA